MLFLPHERRLAGHHLDPGMKSEMCYSREAYTLLCAKILSMFKLIRSKEFAPDLPAIDRVVQLSGQPTEQAAQGAAEGLDIDVLDGGAESSVA